MIKWIVQHNLIKEKTLNAFRNAFHQHNIAYEEVMVIPFSEELPSFEIVSQPIFYGSTTLMMNAYSSEHAQGVFFKKKSLQLKTTKSIGKKKC